MSKTDRVYKIEMLIRHRGHVSFATLLEELEISPATLKRDLEYLRSRLGAPIEYDRFLNGYKFGEEYRGEKHELPGLWFNAQEIVALLTMHRLLEDLDSGGLLGPHVEPLMERLRAMLGSAQASAEEVMRRVKVITAHNRPVAPR